MAGEDHWFNATSNTIGADAAAQWRHAYDCLDRLRQAQLWALSDDVDAFREWLPRVARYSFPTGSLADLADETQSDDGEVPEVARSGEQSA